MGFLPSFWDHRLSGQRQECSPSVGAVVASPAATVTAGAGLPGSGDRMPTSVDILHSLEPMSPFSSPWTRNRELLWNSFCLPPDHSSSFQLSLSPS